MIAIDRRPRADGILTGITCTTWPYAFLTKRDDPMCGEPKMTNDRGNVVVPDLLDPEVELLRSDGAALVDGFATAGVFILEGSVRSS